jgi:GGDEF domain-containing protein
MTRTSVETGSAEGARELLRPTRLAATIGLAGAGAAGLVLGAAGVPAKGPLLALLAALLAMVAATACVRRMSRLGRAAREATELGRVDPESGLPGALALEDDLRQAMDESAASRSPVAVVVVSLDDPRALHVERGISAGRRLLRQAAEALASSAGAYGGRTYRLHGTALAAVLPGTTHAEGERLARRLEPSLALLTRRTNGLVRLVAGSAVALPGDLPEDVLVRAERRCAALREGAEDEHASVLRPLSNPTH